mmetsp:Transcript_5795/g.10638  ORF Transcript_5795/g.10638 Transcript_5795/m.10638 type:complete len:279 (-) Transcript_5795:991-1827(-)
MAGCRKRSPSEEPPRSSKHAKAAGGCSYKFETLKREIIARSIADDWEQARHEWTLEHVYRKDHDAPGTCLCTHYPIIEVCVMAHDNSGKEVNVGNCCVKKFFQLPSDTIFAAVRRVQQDRDKALNTATIDFAYEHEWISDWDYQFYMDTFRKRKLSQRQHEQRERINAKILDRTSTCKASDEDGDGNLWLLDKMVLDEAHEQGRISWWEVDFYAGNYGKDCVRSSYQSNSESKRRLLTKKILSSPGRMMLIQLPRLWSYSGSLSGRPTFTSTTWVKHS